MADNMVKVKIPGTYTMVVNDKLEIVSVTNQMIYKGNMSGAYTIVLNDKLETVSATHKGQLLTKRSDLTNPKFKPENFEKNPATGEVIVPPELQHGCVGLYSISESLTQTDPCIPVWGMWL